MHGVLRSRGYQTELLARWALKPSIAWWSSGSVGRRFQSQIVSGKNEFAYRLELQDGWRNFEPCPRVVGNDQTRWEDASMSIRCLEILYSIVRRFCFRLSVTVWISSATRDLILIQQNKFCWISNRSGVAELSWTVTTSLCQGCPL